MLIVMNKVISLILLLALASCTSCNTNTGNISDLKPGTTITDAHFEKMQIAPGEEYTLSQIDGAGMITYFYITDGRGGIEAPNIVLRVYWDGLDVPSINVPLADFFGSIKNINVDYESKYLTLSHYCYQCYFPMPFSKGAKFVLYNDGTEIYNRSVAWNIEAVVGAEYAHNKSRFHAFYNRSNPTNGSHTILDIEGRGHYVGNIMHVYTLSPHWWGEGDTDFVLDGKTMKHSPGTEDEYGGCWEFGEKYSYQTCGYIIGGIPMEDYISYSGHNRMYRWYDSNPVRFRKSLKVTIENQYWSFTKGTLWAKDDYTTVAYYYLEGAQGVDLLPYEQRASATKAELVEL